jgi:hypothetical protein
MSSRAVARRAWSADVVVASDGRKNSLEAFRS